MRGDFVGVEVPALPARAREDGVGELADPAFGGSRARVADSGIPARTDGFELSGSNVGTFCWGLTPSQRAEANKQKARGQNMRHPAFPRGPPPQYYPGPTALNFAVRMGSGDPR